MNFIATIPRCPKCSGDNVSRLRVITERVSLLGHVRMEYSVSRDAPVWTDDYECETCGAEWNELDRA